MRPWIWNWKYKRSKCATDSCYLDQRILWRRYETSYWSDCCRRHSRNLWRTLVWTPSLGESWLRRSWKWKPTQFDKNTTSISICKNFHLANRFCSWINIYASMQLSNRRASQRSATSGTQAAHSSTLFGCFTVNTIKVWSSYRMDSRIGGMLPLSPLLQLSEQLLQDLTRLTMVLFCCLD